MKVVFWSLYHGQSGTTANMLALSGFIALHSSKRTLIMHNQLQHSALEHYLGLEASEIATKGIDPIMAHLKNMSLRAEEINEYSTSILKGNRYDVLQGTMHNKKSIHQEFTDIFRASIELADKYYDYVFIDASAGENNGIQELMETADIIVINANQSSFVLEETKEFYETLKPYHDKIELLIGNYDKDNKLTIRNIKGKYGFKKIQKLPYNPIYANYLNDSKVLEFIHINKNAGKTDPNYNYMQDLEEAAKEIFDFKRG